MTFSDEDLKRLEGTFAKPEYHQDISEDVAIWILNKQESLLSRLKAAENLVEVYRNCRINGFDILKVADSTEWWRKMAGK